MVWVLSLSDMDLSTHAPTAAAVSWHSGSSGVGGGEAPFPIGAHLHASKQLHQMFRGELSPSLIYFTLTHRSSKYFSTYTGSVLPETIGASTRPWVDHNFSSSTPTSRRPIQTCFRFRFPEAILNRRSNS